MQGDDQGLVIQGVHMLIEGSRRLICRFAS